MLAYFLYIITVCLLIIFIYIKLRYRFWSSQPIFHTYNLYYWLYPPGILQHEVPKKTKFYDYSITCTNINNLDYNEKCLLFGFIKMNYKIRDKFEYCNNKQGFINIFPALGNISLQHTVLPRRLISCLTSRPLEYIAKENKFTLFYLDFLCVHRKFRKKGLGAKQIFTHYLEARKKNIATIFVYKCMGLGGIRVPITTFKIYTIMAQSWNKVNVNLPRNISTYLINSANSKLLIHFFKELTNQFDCVIMPKIFTLVKLIAQDYILPTIILDNQKVVCATFFRKPIIKIGGQYTIECIGSYCRKGYEDTFRESFSNSIVLLQKQYKFSMISIENISHNYILLHKILKRSIPKRIDIAGYYFYNCALAPHLSPEVFIIN